MQSHLADKAGGPCPTHFTQTRVRKFSQMGCRCSTFNKARKGDQYILSGAHASELSHQDVEIRDRVMDAFSAVHFATKELEKDQRLVRAVPTHCARTMIQACTRYARIFSAESCQGFDRYESHYNSIFHPIFDAFVSRQALAKAIKPGILTWASPKSSALKNECKQKTLGLRSSADQV